MIVTIPREVQSGNALAYRHWRHRQRDKMAWVGWLAHLAGRRHPPAEKQAVRITAYRKRLLDDDNLVAGCKHLRDALTVVGLIADDDAKHAAFTYQQELASRHPSGSPCTVVEVDVAC